MYCCLKQGEGNANNAKAYQCQFPAMIEDWRNQFYKRSDGQTSENFPFGFVQVNLCYTAFIY